jgi:NAD(P)-dependent dehydrogenase (short-subunit alcohol dehydrogenase family)
VLPCNLADRASREAFLTGLTERFPTIELLVNNGGMAPRIRADILEAGEESFDELIGTNLKGPYFLTQPIARAMAGQRHGRIVFISSISAFTASVNRGDYCISKAGLSMAAKLFAARLAPVGVSVFEIQPGIVRTDMIAAVASTYEEKIANGLLPQRRMGEPKDVARAVRAIADGLLDYCAGQTLHVDGGFHLRTL